MPDSPEKVLAEEAIRIANYCVPAVHGTPTMDIIAAARSYFAAEAKALLVFAAKHRVLGVTGIGTVEGPMIRVHCSCRWYSDDAPHDSELETHAAHVLAEFEKGDVK